MDPARSFRLAFSSVLCRINAGNRACGRYYRAASSAGLSSIMIIRI